MSAPMDRLIGDGLVARFEHDALAVLSEQVHYPLTQQLALATLALIRDRSARQELSVIERQSAS
jgi:hypothetical protein